MTKYDDLNFNELRALCKKRGLNAGGKKQDMIQRLEGMDALDAQDELIKALTTIKEKLENDNASLKKELLGLEDDILELENKLADGALKQLEDQVWIKGLMAEVQEQQHDLKSKGERIKTLEVMLTEEGKKIAAAKTPAAKAAANKGIAKLSLMEFQEEYTAPPPRGSTPRRSFSSPKPRSRIIFDSPRPNGGLEEAPPVAAAAPRDSFEEANTFSQLDRHAMEKEKMMMMMMMQKEHGLFED